MFGADHTFFIKIYLGEVGGCWVTSPVTLKKYVYLS